MQEKRHDRVVEMRLCFFLGKVGDYNVSFVETRMCRSTEHGILCEWIFTDGNGSYTHARNITDCMTRLCRENKLNGGGITKLRKTTSSDLQAKGTPKSVVASMLGHTTEVNEKYYTYDTSNLAEKKKIIQERNAKFKNLAHTG